MTNYVVFIGCVKCKTKTVCKRISLVTGGGEHFSKTFSIFYMLNSKSSFQPIFFNWYLSKEKTAFVDKSKVEPTIFFIEKKISFSLKLFSGHFYKQCFI